MQVRDKSKQRRRRRILEAAKQILIREGYDGLTTRGLADLAEVTVPTIYNLIGSKDDVLRAVIAGATERVWNRWTVPSDSASLDVVEDWLAVCLEVIGEDEALNRATVIASDRVSGVYTAGGCSETVFVNPAARAVEMATRISASLQGSGALFGKLSAESLGEQMFICFRDPLRDWGHGEITLEEFGRRFSRGVFMVLCADATDTIRKDLVEKLRHLEVKSARPRRPIAAGE